MIPGSKVLSHDKLACQWVKDFMTRPNMSVIRPKGVSLAVDSLGHLVRSTMKTRIFGRIVRVQSTEQSVGIIWDPTS